uniref:Uncharacterized protein n=1 Tax=Oryza glumipatula TaxID=40148 RepID=A0A0D9YBL3_9ORYZ
MIPCRTLLDVSLVMRLSARTSSSRRSTSGCGRPSSRIARLRRARQRPTTLTRRKSTSQIQGGGTT